MSTFTQQVSYGWNPLDPRGTQAVGLRNYGTKPEEEVQVIEIEDIEEITDVIAVDKVKSSTTPFIYLIGVTPTPALFSDVKYKLPLAILVSAIFSIWVSNITSLSILAILAVLNLLTSIIWDKSENYRIKLSRFVADLLIVGVSGTLVEYLFGNLTIPFTQISFSILSIILWFMIVSYLSLITKRLYPLTSIAQSKTLVDIALACKAGMDHAIDNFKDRQQDKITRQKSKKRN
jgi:hypothetical protein